MSDLTDTKKSIDKSINATLEDAKENVHSMISFINKNIKRIHDEYGYNVDMIETTVDGMKTMVLSDIDHTVKFKDKEVNNETRTQGANAVLEEINVKLMRLQQLEDHGGTLSFSNSHVTYVEAFCPCSTVDTMFPLKNGMYNAHNDKRVNIQEIILIVLIIAALLYIGYIILTRIGFFNIRPDKHESRNNHRVQRRRLYDKGYDVYDDHAESPYINTPSNDMTPNQTNIVI